MGILGDTCGDTIRFQEEDFLLKDLFFDFERRDCGIRLGILGGYDQVPGGRLLTQGFVF